MPSDAKCGLIVGVVAVIAIAILFFQRPSGGAPGNNAPPQASIPKTKTDLAKTELPKPYTRPSAPGLTVSRQED
jgi:hypothetical protein